jgi:hypothetical protein
MAIAASWKIHYDSTILKVLKVLKVHLRPPGFFVYKEKMAPRKKVVVVATSSKGARSDE